MMFFSWNEREKRQRRVLCTNRLGERKLQGSLNGRGRKRQFLSTHFTGDWTVSPWITDEMKKILIAVILSCARNPCRLSSAERFYSSDRPQNSSATNSSRIQLGGVKDESSGAEKEASIYVGTAHEARPSIINYLSLPPDDVVDKKAARKGFDEGQAVIFSNSRNGLNFPTLPTRNPLFRPERCFLKPHILPSGMKSSRKTVLIN